MAEVSNSYYNSLKEGMRKNPENFLQPGPVREKLTGKWMVNPDFFKEYRTNPFNKNNKHDIYLEKDIQWHYDQMRKKKSIQDYQSDIRDYYWFLKWSSVYVDQSYHQSNIECLTCTCQNHPDNVLCWYCCGNLKK